MINRELNKEQIERIKTTFDKFINVIIDKVEDNKIHIEIHNTVDWTYSKGSYKHLCVSLESEDGERFIEKFDIKSNLLRKFTNYKETPINQHPEEVKDMLDELVNTIADELHNNDFNIKVWNLCNGTGCFKRIDISEKIKVNDNQSLNQITTIDGNYIPKGKYEKSEKTTPLQNKFLKLLEDILELEEENN